MMNIHGWDWVYVALVAISLLLAANQHGKPRSDTDFWVTLIAAILGVFVVYMGGLFQ